MSKKVIGNLAYREMLFYKKPICTYVCMYVCIVCMFVCMYVCVYVMYVCMQCM